MLREKILAVIREVNEVVAERETTVECIAIALLTRKNLFILGETGQAKSYTIDKFRERIDDSKQFVRLLTKQTDEEALFGRIDLKSYIDGNPKMITTGKIPDVDIVFLDEIFKCNDGVLNSLLMVLNERRYTNESQDVIIPVISFFSASNEIPDFNNPDEKILLPLYDRFELKVKTEYIQSRENRQQMLLCKQNNQTGHIKATITLDNLKDMQHEVEAVKVPVEINELMDDILCELRGLNIQVSDRKFLNYYPLAQAKAWLSGRDTVAATDLSVMKYYLWTSDKDIPTIQKVLDKFCLNPLQEELRKITSLAEEIRDEFNANADANLKNAMVKFQNELGKTYRMILKIKKATTDTESEADIAKAIGDLEHISKKAHEKAGAKYVPFNLL